MISRLVVFPAVFNVRTGRRGIQAVVRSVMRAGLICAVSLLGLFGCAPTYLEQRTDEAQNAADVVRGADLRPRFPQAPRTSDAGAPSGGFTLFGSSAPAASAQAATANVAIAD